MSRVINQLYIILFISVTLSINGCKEEINSHETTREVINNQGQKLEMTFSNNEKNLTITFQDKTIHLTKDTNSQNEIKYTSEEYAYINFNGTTSLKKGDTILFIHNQ